VNRAGRRRIARRVNSYGIPTDFTVTAGNVQIPRRVECVIHRDEAVLRDSSDLRRADLSIPVHDSMVWVAKLLFNRIEMIGVVEFSGLIFIDL
jgi:hypothetical protein